MTKVRWTIRKDGRSAKVAFQGATPYRGRIRISGALTLPADLTERIADGTIYDTSALALHVMGLEDEGYTVTQEILASNGLAFPGLAGCVDPTE